MKDIFDHWFLVLFIFFFFIYLKIKINKFKLYKLYNLIKYLFHDLLSPFFENKKKIFEKKKKVFNYILIYLP